MAKKDCNDLLDYFNDTLSLDERKRFEQHLNNCSECQEQYAELSAFNEDVASFSPEVEPPLGMKKRILDAVFEEDQQQEAVPIRPVPQSNDPEQPRKQSQPWWGLIAAAALLLSVGVNIYTSTQMNQLEASVKALEEERNELLAVVNEINETDQTFAQIVTSTPLAGMDSDLQLGTASILKGETGYQLVVQVAQMPELHQSEVYQVWMIREGTPYPAGSFVTNEQGEGAVTFTMEPDDELIGEAIAISLETQPNNQEPEGEILTLSEL